MIKLRDPLVANERVRGRRKQRVSAGGRRYHGQQRFRGGYAELIDGGAFLVGENRSGASYALHTPESQVRHEEEGLVPLDWATQIGIKVVRLPVRLARQTRREGFDRSGGYLLKEWHRIQYFVPKGLLEDAMEAVPAGLRHQLDVGSRITAVFGLGCSRYHAELLESVKRNLLHSIGDVDREIVGIPAIQQIVISYRALPV